MSAEMYHWIDNELDNLMSEYEEMKSKRHVFPIWFLKFWHDADEETAFSNCNTLKQGDLGCDGFFFDQETNRFYLVQSKLPDEYGKQYDSSPLQEVHYAYSQLQTPYGIGNEKLRKIGQQMLDAQADGAVIVLQAVVAGIISNEFQKQAENLADPEKGLYIELVSLSRLTDHRALIESGGDLSSEKAIRFALHSEQTATVDPPAQVPGVGNAVLCNLNASQFASVVGKWRPRIFEANVRRQLRKSNRVNKQIIRVLSKDEERPMFWYYNNGVTVVCDSFFVDAENSFIEIKNPQIVNGCQTSSALADAKAQGYLNEDFPIAAKITEVRDVGDGNAIALNIAEATNSQSNVKESDLKSNDKVHKLLFASLKNYSASKSWFYEYKRGLWDDSNQATKKQFTKLHRVDLESFGQRWRAFAGSPIKAVTDKGKLFSDNALYQKVYDAKRNPAYYALSLVSWNFFNWLMNKSGSQVRDNIQFFKKERETRLSQLHSVKNLWVALAADLVRCLVLLENDKEISDDIEEVEVGKVVQWVTTL